MRRSWRTISFATILASVFGACTSASNESTSDSGGPLPPDASDVTADSAEDRRVFGPIDATADADVDAASDATADAGIILLTPQGWSSPNDASWSTTEAGTFISAHADDNHPILVPSPPLAIPAEDFTLRATFIVKDKGELGLLTRGQPDGGFAVFGTQIGGEDKAWLGTRFAPLTIGPLYAFAPGRWVVKVRVTGAFAEAKIWPESAPEPAAFSVSATTPFATGKMVGFYTYGVVSALLERLVVTVP